MVDLRARGEHIDRVTVFSAMKECGESEHDTLSYLVSLDDGLPRIPNLDSYVRIIQGHAERRRIILSCEHLRDRAALGSESLPDIIAAGQEAFSGNIATGQTYRSIEDIPSIKDCRSTAVEYICREWRCGTVNALTGDSGSGKSTLATAQARDILRNKGISALFLDKRTFAARLPIGWSGSGWRTARASGFGAAGCHRRHRSRTHR